MNCKDVREAHPVLNSEARAHVAQCSECRAFVDSWDLLGEYPGIPVPGGFYRGVRRKLAPAILRFAAPLAAAAAVFLMALLLTTPSNVKTAAPVVTEEERELVENLELLQNYDLLKTLELVGENGTPLIEDKK